MLKSAKVDVLTSFIKYQKDDVDYRPFVDDDHDPLDGSPVDSDTINNMELIKHV